MKQNDETEKILSKLRSLKSLGEIMVVKTETDLKRETGIKREAQIELREQTDINNMIMNIETKIERNMGQWISDMICLMDGRVIVVDGGCRVILFTADGKQEKHLPIAGEAWSVTQINQNSIAISFPRKRVIKIINMEKDTVTKVIKLDKVCYGLSFCNNSLAVGLISNDGGEIHIIDLEGNTLKSIQVQSKSAIYNLVYCNDRLTYSDCDGKAVYCYGESGKQIWQYKQDLSGLEGLCTDAYGKIIVADKRYNRIIVISKDGQDSRVLIKKEDGLKNPEFICFKHNESSGYICDNFGIYLAKFNLSYG